MALKNWYETLGSGDCLKDHVTWNDFIDYVKHSACTDFTIHSTCTSTGQAFRFTHDGDGTSTMYGGTNAGDNLYIHTNDADTYPWLGMIGGEGITLFTSSNESIAFREQLDIMFEMKLNGVISELYGGDSTGDDMQIIANSSDTYPYIKLEGDSDISLYSSDDIYFYDDADEEFRFYDNSIDIKGDRAIYINDDETYIGHGAGDSITSGVGNTLLGHDAGNDLTEGDYNTIIGYEAMDANTDNDNCVCIGAYAGENNTQDGIVAIGYEALKENNGSNNVAVGYQALTNNTDGAYNLSIGLGAGKNITTGSFNTCFGTNAGWMNQTGDDNTLLGHGAGSGGGLNNFSGCVYVGKKAGYNQSTSNRLYINNSDSAYPLIYGEFDNDIVKFGDNDNEFFFKFSFDASDAVLETESTDNNIYLKPNGSGVVKFGTYAALSGETVSGYITIKDAAGNTRKLAVVA